VQQDHRPPASGLGDPDGHPNQLPQEPLVVARAVELPVETGKELAKLARNVYRILKIRGFGRLDVRLTANGELFVIEANPNPQIAKGEDFAASAEKLGMTYEAVLQRMGGEVYRERGR
jgi:hypothetical protein